MGSEYEIGDEIFPNVEIIDIHGGKNKSGFGVVYIVRDNFTGFILALKTLQKDKISISDFNDIKNEIYPWIEVSDHPNIVSVFSVDLDDNKRPYILMEPVFQDECGCLSLTDYMENGSLDEIQILKWCIQFCNAMEYVNQKGFTHGDVKSDNILISEGIIKITDFGLAKSIKNHSIGEVSEYSSRNELKNIFDDVSFDIYSFGIVMYQMINEGKFPAYNENDGELEIYNENSSFPNLNAYLSFLIKKCTVGDSKKRYSSFKELNTDLIKLLDEKYSQKVENPKLIDIGNIKYSNRGHLAAMCNDLENCKKYYDIAISQSDNKLILFNYALDLKHLYQFSDALPYLFKLSDDPDILSLDRIYFNIAHCYHEKVCLYKSIEYYRKTIKLNNDFLKAHVNLANVYRDFGLFTWALDHYNYVLEKNDNFQEALINIVYLYEKMGDVENYNKYKSKLTSVNLSPMIKFNVGLFFKEGNVPKFLSYMDEASKVYVSQIPALIKLFEFYLSNNNLSEANTKFDEIFEESGDIKLMVHLCFTYRDYGFIEEGITKINYILDVAPSSEKEHVLFEKSMLIQKFSKDDAIDLCNDLISHSNDEEFKSKLYVNLGNIYGDIDYEKSFEYFLKASNLNPNNLVALLNLSTYYARKDEFFIAETFIDQGLNVDNWNYDLLFNKGSLCRDQFKFKDAITYFNKCLKLKPTSDVYGFVSYCFHELDNLFESLFYLRLAINICEDNSSKLQLMTIYLFYYVELYHVKWES